MSGTIVQFAPLSAAPPPLLPLPVLLPLPLLVLPPPLLPVLLLLPLLPLLAFPPLLLPLLEPLLLLPPPSVLAPMVAPGGDELLKHAASIDDTIPTDIATCPS